MYFKFVYFSTWKQLVLSYFVHKLEFKIKIKDYTIVQYKLVHEGSVTYFESGNNVIWLNLGLE